MPELAAAVRTGDISVDQAVVVVHTVRDCPGSESVMVDAARTGLDAVKSAAQHVRARTLTPGELAARQRSKRAFWSRVDENGMVAGGFRLTPTDGAEFVAVIEAGAQQRFRAQPGGQPFEQSTTLAADVLVDLVRIAVTSINAQAANSKRSATTGTNPHNSGASTRDATSHGPTSLFDTNDDDHDSGHDDDYDDPHDERGLDQQADAGGGHSADQRTVPPSEPGRWALTERPLPALRPTVHVVIDHQVLTEKQPPPGTRCDIPGTGNVDPEWVRSIIGDAFLTFLVKDGVNITTVAHAGRSIPTHLRTALQAGGYRCCVDGCTASAWLEADHSDIDYAKGGVLSWANTDWLCKTHHRQKTAGAILGPRQAGTRLRTLTPTERARSGRSRGSDQVTGPGVPSNDRSSSHPVERGRGGSAGAEARPGDGTASVSRAVDRSERVPTG
jgi:hypothetical protein